MMSSVPVEERDEGTLRVNTAARNMAAYTLHITANPKHFDESHKDLILMIRKLAVGICVKCWRANNIKVGKNERRYIDRITLQEQAADDCNDLCCLIELAQPVFHMTTRRKCHWKHQVEEVRNIIRGWHDKDVQRLKP